jgi:hypothetical protein
MDDESPITLLRRETRVSAGLVPLRLGGHEIPPEFDLLVNDEYILRTAYGLAYHYRKGEGVTVERQPGSDPATELLFLNGSVYAAVAAINGFLPVHASAVAHGGQVHAFTGPSGAGKSTLTAALGTRGLPLFCDDTLILDLSGPGAIRCLPGHKRLKLWPDAVELAGAAPQERIAADLEKVFAEPASGSVDEMLPLAQLVFLEEGGLGEGGPMRIEPIRGAERLLRLQDDHYTQALFIAASRPNRAERFAQLSRLAVSMEMNRFVRPRDRRQFGAGVTMVENHVRAMEDR